MKKVALPLAVILLIALAVFWTFFRPDTSVPKPPAATPAPAPQAEAPSPIPQEPSVQPKSTASPTADVTKTTQATAIETRPAAAEGQPPEMRPPVAEMRGLPPDKAMESLRVNLHNYGQRFHGNPVGNNAEITAALNGKNPQQVKFLDPNVTRINDKGELVDEWGTPYFFHQISGTVTEIRSAGRDRKMWTADDLVTR